MHHEEFEEGQGNPYQARWKAMLAFCSSIGLASKYDKCHVCQVQQVGLQHHHSAGLGEMFHKISAQVHDFISYFGSKRGKGVVGTCSDCTYGIHR